MKRWNRKSSLKFDVYIKLKEAILSGDLEDDMSITQRMAQELYGVSGTPFREAIQILESEGLVYSLPNKGVYVHPLTLTDVKEVFQIRKIMETSIAEIVAKNFDQQKYKELKSIIQKMNPDSTKQTRSDFTKYDHLFHKRLIEYTDNNRLMLINEQVYDVMRRVGNILLKEVKRRDSVIDEHKEILKGLKSGNTRDPVIEHLDSVWKEINKYI